MAYDVIVVGGGPSGMMAAISARLHGSTVILIEKNDELGFKMKISGGGRCNLSNTAPINELIENIPGNGRFLYSGLNQFSNIDVIKFFEEELKVKTKVEDRGRVFPVSDRSKTLIDALRNYLLNSGVKILFNSEVEDISIIDKSVKGVLLKDGSLIEGNKIILGTGGISYPKTGSTGAGLEIAKSLGHSISDLYPSSVPLLSDDNFITDKILQGVSLRNVELTLYDSNKKKVISEYGDMIFTHFGISGPVVYRVSRYVYLTQKKHNQSPLLLELDIFPQISSDELIKDLNTYIKNNQMKLTINGFTGLLPEKILTLIISEIGIATKKMVELNQKDLLKLVNLLKAFPINIVRTKPINEAIVTGGGVNIKEINPKTFESKIIEGLYIVGEMLDVDAFTGGYNMQVAFSTGYVAGKSASMRL